MNGRNARGIFALLLTAWLAAACSSTKSFSRPEIAKDSSEPSRPHAKVAAESAAQPVFAGASANRDEEVSDSKKSDEKASAPARKSIDAAETLATDENFHARPPELLSRYDSDELKALPLKAQDISVVVVGHRARVIFDLVFENPSERQVSGEFIVALPDGSSPVYLGMFQGEGLSREKVHAQTAWLTHKSESYDTVSRNELRLSAKWQTQTGVVDWGELRSARVVNPVKGREIYEKVTRQRIDPALAEWSGASKFTTQIFPIPAKGYKRVVFAYEGPVNMSNGQFLYALPWPRKNTSESRMTVHVAQGHYAQVNVVRENALVGDREETAYGSRFVFKSAKLSGEQPLQMVARAKNPDLQILSAENDDLDATLSHVRLRLVKKAQRLEVQSGRAVFVVDVSYSAKEKLHNFSGKMMRQLLTHDASIKEFSVLAFDVTSQKLFPFMKNNSKNRERVLKKISSIHLEGATNFQSVLEFIKNDEELTKADTFFLLSDGQITWAEEKPLDLQRKYDELFQKRWITYRFGDNAVNQSLFDALTKYSGRLVQVNVGDDLTVAATAHIQSGIPLGKISVSPGADFLVAGNPRFVYPGQFIELAIKQPKGVRKMDIEFDLQGKKRKISADFSPETKADSVATRAWAMLYANRLLDLHDQEADGLVLALSQKFYLSNRAASFIILETDKEYHTHKIEPEKYKIDAIQRRVAASTRVMGYSISGAEKISAGPQKLLRELRRLQTAAIYDAPAARVTKYDLMSVLKRDKNTPIDIYRQANVLYEKEPGQALRALSSIVELQPQDDKALRMTGFVLLQWGLYQPASELFARSRQRRPFEPQNYMLEALAQTAMQKAFDAALLYETVLHNEYQRFDSYAKISTAVLYSDLLKSIRASGPEKLVELIDLRLKELSAMQTGIADRKPAKGRLLLFWNLDNTDVDLHVNEGPEEVSYSKKDSATGGKLHWDNTAGLGPELYEHHSLSQEGFSVTVNYFGSSAVEGQAPSTTLVVAFLYYQNKITARFYTTALIDKKTGKIEIMPKFRP